MYSSIFPCMYYTTPTTTAQRNKAAPVFSALHSRASSGVYFLNIYAYYHFYCLLFIHAFIYSINHLFLYSFVCFSRKLHSRASSGTYFLKVYHYYHYYHLLFISLLSLKSSVIYIITIIIIIYYLYHYYHYYHLLFISLLS